MRYFPTLLILCLLSFCVLCDELSFIAQRNTQIARGLD
jgi:hypothetical protein